MKKIGEGKTTEVYLEDNKAIKIYYNTPIEHVKQEANQQSYAVAKGLPVPKVYGVRKIDEEKIALEMEYIPGKPLLREGMSKEECHAAIQTLVRLQCALHAICVETKEIPKQRDVLHWKIKDNQHIGNEKKEQLYGLLESLNADEYRLCHGDFHPLNVIYDREKYWVIDWVDVTAGNPLADACRTYVIFKQYISRLSGIYLRYFCEEAGVTKEDVLKWLPVIVGARLSESLDEKERMMLLRLLE